MFVCNSCQYKHTHTHTAEPAGRAFCKHSTAGIADSNPAHRTVVGLIVFVCCLGTDFCDDPITRPVDSCRLYLCLSVSVIQKPQQCGDLVPSWNFAPQKRKRVHQISQLLTYLLTYLLTHSLHGAQSFFRR